LAGELDDSIQRNVSQMFKSRTDHKWGEDEIAGVRIGKTLSISRLLVDWSSDVVPPAHEGKAAVVVPMPQFVAGAESPTDVRGSGADIHDGAVLEPDDLRFAPDERTVL
jgi:hypothetical protein